MNPIILAAGIHLTAEIVSIIANELTERELQNQQQLEKTVESIIQHREEGSIQETSNTTRNDDKQEPTESMLFNCLDDGAEERIKEIEKRKEQILNVKKEVNHALKSNRVYTTPLRKNSLELLKRQLDESIEKCIGYVRYLKTYKGEIYKIRYEERSIPVFSWMIPSEYPYVGKMIWVSSSNVIDETVELNIANYFSVLIHIEDYSDIDIPEDSSFPIMICRGGRYDTDFYASVEKGMFKAYELSNTRLGIEATVENFNNRRVTLLYKKRLQLSLPTENLMKPYRFPAVFSKVRVFPTWWNYDLQSRRDKKGREKLPAVIVSERQKDVSTTVEYDSFPISFDLDGFNDFQSFYKANNLEQYDEEYLIGPADGKYTGLHKGAQLKLQFGDIPLFIIEIGESIEETGYSRYYFKYHHMCAEGEKTFDADDIFVPFDVTFTPYFEGTSDNDLKQYAEIDDLGDISTIIWDVFEELRIQNQIKTDREGTLFFYKWESITDQLISVLETIDSTRIKMQWRSKEIKYDNEGAYVVGEIVNPEDFSCFVDRVKTGVWDYWIPRFYIKDEDGYSCEAEVAEGGSRFIIRGRQSSLKTILTKAEILLLAQNPPYVEKKEKEALRQFRIGQLVNPNIQAACMNSAGIVPQRDEHLELFPFHNTSLYNNKSQNQAVEVGLKEKNIFFIQGPPGSGKTTVIRELVEQEIAVHKDSRILIVSQSNVAVDTVLRGLPAELKEQIVRCGHEEKISPSLQSVQLQRQCKQYMMALEKRKDQFEESFYEKWKKTILLDNHMFAPALNELIIKNHRIIGATCLGIANKNIGIERIEFDLVIIDEAGRALPAELVIPLLRARKAIIIGDQQQLPPVIDPILFDEEIIELDERAVSENELFCHSFFERLYNNAPEESKIMLDTQYRMPALIGTIISALFYNGKLKNGKGTEARKSILFSSSLSFINYDGDESYHESTAGDGITNHLEAEHALNLVKKIRRKDKSCTIALITPYRGQRDLIRSLFLTEKHFYQDQNIEIDTIDAFQGNEADVVIFCMTRAKNRTAFFNDDKRLNVALSRARQELIILGKLQYMYSYTDSCLPTLAYYIESYGNVIRPYPALKNDMQ